MNRLRSRPARGTRPNGVPSSRGLPRRWRFQALAARSWLGGRLSESTAGRVRLWRVAIARITRTRERNLENEPRAVRAQVLGPEPPSVGLNNLAAEWKSQTGAAGRAVVAGLRVAVEHGL